jgi:hypothetical protein
VPVTQGKGYHARSSAPDPGLRSEEDASRPTRMPYGLTRFS